MSRKQLLIALGAGLCAGGLSIPASAHDEPVIGVVAGAGIGAAIAGPPGAVVGAVIGTVAGAHIAHESDHGHHHRGERRVVYRETVVREPVRYVYPAGYAAERAPIGARCEPEAPAYRVRVVRADDRPLRATSTKARPKMKKVCRYVSVKATRTG